MLSMRLETAIWLAIVGLLALGGAAAADALDLQDLNLKSASLRNTTTEVLSDCTVPAGDTICAAPGENLFDPGTIKVDCRTRCTIELHLCLDYSLFSPTALTPVDFGASVWFIVDGATLFGDRANHILDRLIDSPTNQKFGSRCFLAFVPTTRGHHTIGVVAGAEVFTNGSTGDQSSLRISSANLVIRVYQP